MQPDPRIEWLRENVSSFKAAHDAAEKARQETEANRMRFAEEWARQVQERPQ